MRPNRPRRFNRRTAQQLLRGAAAGRAVDGAAAVRSLLAAAAAPARAEELAGQSVALAAFRAARLDPVHPEPKRSMIKSVAARSFSTRIAAIAIAAVAFGGVATAAVTGHLPTHIGPPVHVPSTSSHAVAPVVPSTSTMVTAGGSHLVRIPDLAGGCQTGAGHGKALGHTANCAAPGPGAAGKPSAKPQAQQVKPSHPTHTNRPAAALRSQAHRPAVTLPRRVAAARAGGVPAPVDTARPPS